MSTLPTGRAAVIEKLLAAAQARDRREIQAELDRHAGEDRVVLLSPALARRLLGYDPESTTTFRGVPMQVDPGLDGFAWKVWVRPARS
jgi:hypothetical protein